MSDTTAALVGSASGLAVGIPLVYFLSRAVARRVVKNWERKL